LAFRIAQRTLKFLGTNGFGDAEVPGGNFAAEKPVAETAMLLHVAAQHRSDPCLEKEFTSLARELLPLARSTQMAWDVLRHPSVCLQLATPHILLRLMGYPDDRWDRLLALAEATSVSRAHEVVPYRELELLWLHSLWHRQLPGPEFDMVATKTALANSIDLLNGTRDDAYAHTHAIMYYTDFGRWQRSLPRPAAEVLDDSAAVLARALLSEDYDLAAEALMAWPLLSRPWSAAAAFGFRVVASLEDKTGFLPPGRSASKHILALTGEAQTRHALASSYHTAYVMGMLCALALNPEMTSPFDLAAPRFPGGLVASLKAFISETGAHWESVFESLNPDEQTTLAPFLLDIALIQNSRKRDFGQMARLLELAVQHGLATTTLCAQSAEFLSRVSAFASLNI
jgi:hypothetical protein